ncbi:lipopolysaccharide heptosyltransferase family protein, partial [Parasulfuritortus cantonensis]
MAADLGVPSRVLIVRLSAIGDVILASGLIPMLKAAWPGVEIAWLTEEANAGLLRHNPRLSRLYTLPRGRWAKLWREGRYLAVLGELRDLVRRLRAARFDLVLDTQGLLKSGVLARASGARQRIGLGSKEGSRLLMTRVVSRAVTSHLPGKEYRALGRALGLDERAYRLDVVPGAEDQAAAAALCAESGLTAGFAVFCPFTTRPQKHWFDERWIELARLFQAEFGVPVAWLGGPGDRGHAEALAAAGGGVCLAGRTSLAVAAALIGRARLLVGVDTGLTHLGLAMARPTLALFGSTRPYLEPDAPRARVLYEP